VYHDATEADLNALIEISELENAALEEEVAAGDALEEVAAGNALEEVAAGNVSG
jgi:hypothetical protein